MYWNKGLAMNASMYNSWIASFSSPGGYRLNIQVICVSTELTAGYCTTGDGSFWNQQTHMNREKVQHIEPDIGMAWHVLCYGLQGDCNECLWYLNKSRTNMHAFNRRQRECGERYECTLSLIWGNNAYKTLKKMKQQWTVSLQSVEDQLHRKRTCSIVCWMASLSLAVCYVIERHWLLLSTMACWFVVEVIVWIRLITQHPRSLFQLSCRCIGTVLVPTLEPPLHYQPLSLFHFRWCPLSSFCSTSFLSSRTSPGKVPAVYLYSHHPPHTA